jgi:hypothetical protein
MAPNGRGVCIAGVNCVSGLDEEPVIDLCLLSPRSRLCQLLAVEAAGWCRRGGARVKAAPTKYGGSRRVTAQGDPSKMRLYTALQPPAANTAMDSLIGPKTACADHGRSTSLYHSKYGPCGMCFDRCG